MLDDLLQRRPYNAAADFVDANVDAGRGGKIAFTDGVRSLTYADLQDGSYRFATALRERGLREETRVILILHDTVDYPVAFWGAIRAGIVPIPLNTLLPPSNMRISSPTAAPRRPWLRPRWPAPSFPFETACRICAW